MPLASIKNTFEEMDEEEKQYVIYYISSIGLGKSSSISSIFKAFLRYALAFSGSLKINSNLLVSEFSRIEELLLDWLVNEDATLNSMTSSMKIKLDKYWGSIDKINKLFFVAHVLDPDSSSHSFKLLSINYTIKRCVIEFLKSVKETLYRLFNYYAVLTTYPLII